MEIRLSLVKGEVLLNKKGYCGLAIIQSNVIQTAILSLYYMNFLTPLSDGVVGYLNRTLSSNFCSP